METTSFNNVADLSQEQRSAVESLVGRPLQTGDMVFLAILRPDKEPAAEAKTRARARLEQVFAKVDRYGQEHGILSDEADEAIDVAVREVPVSDDLMRIVLDTNLVVRAARPGKSLGRAILVEALSERHTLLL